MLLVLLDDHPESPIDLVTTLRRAGYSFLTPPQDPADTAIEAHHSRSFDIPVAVIASFDRGVDKIHDPWKQAIDNRVIEVLRVLEHKFTQPVETRRLAAHVNLGCSRLQHLFKRAIGISIGAYVRNRRLLAAISLIQQTNLRVSEICFRVGFNDVAHFDRVFRRHFGESPTTYRRRHLVRARVPAERLR